MDFGLVAQTNAPSKDVIALAQRAEAAGFTHFWTCLLYTSQLVSPYRTPPSRDPLDEVSS